MKKHLSVLLVFLLTVSLAACGADAPVPTQPVTQPVTQPITQPTTVPTEPATQPSTEPATQSPPPEPGVDLQALYEKLDVRGTPEMILLDAAMMLNYCGIQEADCVQAVVAIASNGLRTDEIWLLQAVDEAAMDRLAAAATARLKAKEEETVSYAPDQYAVVLQAQVLRQGNYLAVLVSPVVADMLPLVQSALAE